jgi:serine/threonine-protein kinase
VLRDLGEPWSTWVDAPARLVVDADVPAEVVLVGDRFVDRYRERGEQVSLGSTPLSVEIPPGRREIRVLAPGRADAVFPLLFRRGREVDLGRVHLPLPIPGACYVPAGPFAAGGDPVATDPVHAGEVEIGGMFVQQFPVTLAEYVAFLEDCGEGERWQPREPAQYGNPGRELIVREGGHWVARTQTSEGPQWGPDWPIVFVTPTDCEAYASWWSGKTGREWALPHDLEWEKAARGLDGRAFPWGDFADPTFANMGRSLATAGQRTAVTAFPLDESPYGIRGLGGNVRDWCCNGYRRSGDGHLVPLPRGAPPDAPWRIQRGGSWMSSEAQQRCASRFVGRPAGRNSSVGFRLVTRL